jgi:hypothetical protein
MQRDPTKKVFAAVIFPVNVRRRYDVFEGE